jgi:hypothetical protein
MNRQRRGSDFLVRFRAEPQVDGIRALRALLKVALRRFRLRAIAARELRHTNPGMRP